MTKKTYETPELTEYVIRLEACIAESQTGATLPGTGETNGDWN